jgi:uncharacterized protein
MLRDAMYTRLARLVTNRPGTILIVCAVLTLGLLAGATRLGMKTQIAEMLPRNLPQIDEYMSIIEDYRSAENIMITLEGQDRDVERMKRCADDLAVRLKAITLHRPRNHQDLSLMQRFAIARGDFPVKGVEYDTLSLVRRIDYKVNADFIASHGMIIQKPSELENMVNMFGSLELPALIANINDNFEKEYIEDSENVTTLDGEGQAVQGLESIRRFLESIEQYVAEGDSAEAAQAVRRFVAGDQYFVSSDNTMLIMMLQPAVSFTQFEEAIYLGERIDDTLQVARTDYPGLDLSRTGSIMYQIDENKALAKDFGWSYLVALGLILLLLVGSFRTWRNPFYSVVTLLVSLVWVSGIIGLIMHYVNMMSAGFGIVLIGLGIDFGIHFISGFRDGREQGMAPGKAIGYMYRRVGAGVVTGALTTAIVFFSMPLTGFKAYAQMGYTMGLGIVVTLGCMMILLPALIAWDSRTWTPEHDRKRTLFETSSFAWFSAPLQFRFLGRLGSLVSRLPVAIAMLVMSLALTVLSFIGAHGLEWEYDFMKLQPVGTESQIAQDKILDRFELSADNSLVRASSLEECRELVEQFKQAGDRTGLIGQVDGITEFMPEPHVQKRNVPVIEQFRTDLEQTPVPNRMGRDDVHRLSQQLVQLHKNIVEIGEISVMSSGEDNKIVRKCDQIVGKRDEDSYVLALANKLGDPSRTQPPLQAYQRIMADAMKTNLLTMASTETVTIDDLPEDIKMRYVNPNNGDLLITVYPKGYIWDEKTLDRYNEVTTEVSERTTGMPAVMSLMMDLIVDKGRLAVGFGAVAIALFLLLDFRSLRYTLLAMIPLAIGSVWMLGLMSVVGVKLSMMSFVALPLILGIGIDDGVHILHRYRVEGRGSVPLVIRYTGRAILLTSLTTMIGFGSMALGVHLGMAALGLTLFLGVGACFVSSAITLPALLAIMERVGGNGKRQPGQPAETHCAQPHSAGVSE